MKILVTGGSGFIGSCFVLQRVAAGDIVLNLDKLTYAGNPENLSVIANKTNYVFVRGDIGDRNLVRRILTSFRPEKVVNFAAESHVDKSIEDPSLFVSTNILGTNNLLVETLNYWKTLSKPEKEGFRFLHVSTDEVYGSLNSNEAPFTEKSPYRPNSPYSASKAGADHLVRAFYETYGLPTLITSCSNNYGPRQYPEKLIPLMILNSIAERPLPIYGDGSNIRDWIYVDDHCDGLFTVLTKASPGIRYNIGANEEKTNLEIVNTITSILDDRLPKSDGTSYKDLIKFVDDRPGHDFRYALDTSAIFNDLGWQAKKSFSEGIRETIEWYLENSLWVKNVCKPKYQGWIKKNYSWR